MANKDFNKEARMMLEFIEKSPTAFHAVANLKEMLEKKGFKELKEDEIWEVKASGKYFVTRNDSAILGFTMPAGKNIKGLHIVASHSDSPSFKIKENPEMTVEDSYVKLNCEKYGGMIMYTWLDRSLSVAGRIAYKENGAIKSKLVNLDRDAFVIPSLAIHMMRDINENLKLNPQIDMLPLFGEKNGDTKDALLGLIAKDAKVKKEDILGHDLFLYVHDEGKIIGANEEFCLSSRLDDLECAYVSTKALTEAKTSDEYINVSVVFDNEEVGSGTKQGADSTFLDDTITRIAESVKASKQELLKWIAGGFLISADNAHAVHPNHPEKADPTNRPYLNGGIVIKYHGSQKYCTDACSAALMKDICNEAKVPFQTYCNKSDIAGGSTLGNISTAHVSIPSVDIGLPQLAMHSAVETAGTKDVSFALKALNVFYNK